MGGFLTFSGQHKKLYWVASSKKDLMALPLDVPHGFGFGFGFGFALHLAQEGGRHVHSKILKGFSGAGVLEVVEDHEGNTFRAVYTVRFGNAVYVLQCFQKKSRTGIKTPESDIALVRMRLRLAQQHSEGQIP